VQLWAEKTGHPSFAPKQGINLRFGQHLEPFVAAEYERATGLVALVHQDPIFHREHRFFFAHVDRLVKSDPNSNHCVDGITPADTVLECKTASAFNQDEWGGPHTDQVPTHYMLQCAWYMAITQCMQADVAVLIGNQDFRIFRIHRNFDLERALLEHAKRFWEECVLKGVPPTPKSSSDAGILYPLIKEGTRIQASAEVARNIERLRELQLHMKDLDQEMEHMKSLVMSCMGESEELAIGDRVLATWKSTKPVKRLDTKALKAAHPDITNAFTLEGPPSRRFVLKEFA